MAKAISQMRLVASIAKYLEKTEKAKHLTVRQLNAIIEAANLIVDALRRDDISAIPNSGLSAWLSSDDRGRSSDFMASVLAKAAFGEGPYCKEPDCPYDTSDFGCCVHLLDVVPELRPHLAKMGAFGPIWAGFAAAWNELEALYREELPRGRAPKLYARIAAIHEAARKQAS